VLYQRPYLLSSPSFVLVFNLFFHSFHIFLSFISLSDFSNVFLQLTFPIQFFYLFSLLSSSIPQQFPVSFFFIPLFICLSLLLSSGAWGSCAASRRVPGSNPGGVTWDFFRGASDGTGVDSASKNEYQEFSWE
jgi:hypothetical protein